MYAFDWDVETGAYRLTTQTGKYVANEIRPVFAEELVLTGMNKRFKFDENEKRPFLWARKNVYLLNGEKVAQLNGVQYGKPLSVEYFFDEKRRKLHPVDVAEAVKRNAPIMTHIVADAKRRIKELYDLGAKRSDVAYIAFSGGKDSVVLLDLCSRVLPPSAPVVFSDVGMELPDSYDVWNEIQTRYPEHEFIKVAPSVPALDYWRIFGPPSRSIRWCCSVCKSSPAIAYLKRRLNLDAVRATAFVGVRGDESSRRSAYEDAADGVKNASQMNCMPILAWGAHELWLYIFERDLLINPAYRKGLTRVGCVMCPESSEKYAWFVDKAYPDALAPYNEIIVNTSAKTFKTKQEETEFIGSSNWQARKSGITLRDTIANPVEDSSTLRSVFRSSHFSKPLFFEWIKTLGRVVKPVDSQDFILAPRKSSEAALPFRYEVDSGADAVAFEFPDRETQIAKLPVIRNLLRKVSACVGCPSCEAECACGALSIRDGRVQIDETKCVGCRKCYNHADYACWRFMSMRVPENPNSASLKINSYKNFGLRENWVSALVDLRDEFFPHTPSHPLGNKMVESASSWFPQANLVSVVGKTKKTTKLVDIFAQYGSSDPQAWDLIWLSLVNRSSLVKFIATETEINVPRTVDDLKEALIGQGLKESAADAGLAAFKDMITKSPLGGADAVTLPELQGRSVVRITRQAKSISPLVALYGLYLAAELTERSAFTVREMLTAELNSAFVSPLVAFGVDPEEFKKICEGLRSRYPDFVSTVFTHGNDQVEIYPRRFGTDDVLALVLEK